MSRLLHRPAHVLAPLLFALALSFGTQAHAAEPEPKEVILSIYHVAPGKQLDFMKWQADRDAIAKEAGVEATQWYVHVDGDSWDYVGIAPVGSEAQDKKIDELTAKRGLTVGFKAGLELRQTMTSHTDTYASGPLTAAEIYAMGQ